MYIEFEDSVTDILRNISRELDELLEEEDVKFVYMGIRELSKAVDELVSGDVSSDNCLVDGELADE